MSPRLTKSACSGASSRSLALFVNHDHDSYPWAFSPPFLDQSLHTFLHNSHHLSPITQMITSTHFTERPRRQLKVPIPQPPFQPHSRSTSCFTHMPFASLTSYSPRKDNSPLCASPDQSRSPWSFSRLSLVSSCLFLKSLMAFLSLMIFSISETKMSSFT